MQQLAAAIRRHVESLVDQYDARLRTMAGYNHLPETMRRELERNVLDLIAQCLEAADSSALIQHVQVRASQWVAMGLDLTWFQQALIVPEDILLPLIDSVEASTFLWRTLNRSQSAVWQLVAERAHEAEQALRQSQQLFQTVMDNIPQAIFWKDKHLVYLGCNRAFAADAGLTSPSEVIGKTDWEMPWQVQAELYRADDSLVMDSGTPKLDYEEPQTTPDGSTIWLRTSKVPMRDPTGQVTAVLGMYEDITQRKQLEQQIQESLERRGRQVQTSTEVSQEIAAAPNLNELFQRVVTLIKERFGYYHAQIFRYEPNQDTVVLVSGYGAAGERMLAEGHKLPMGRGVVGTAAANGKSILAADVAQDEDWRPNRHLPDTKGELAIPIKFRDQVLGILDVQSDQAGRLSEDDRLLLEGLCGQIASAMESTRLLEELRSSEVQLYEALKIARLAYWEYDVEKDLFLFNDQFYSIFHTTAEQHGGYQLSSTYYAQHFVHPDDLAIVGTEIEKALNSTDRHYNRLLEHRILYADGGVGYISVNVNIDRDEHGRILRYYGANQDITERKLAEVELQRSEQLMRTVIDSTPDWIFIKDQQHRYRLANKGYADALHSKPEDFIGKNDLDLGFPEELVKGNPDKGIRGFWADDRLVMDSGETQVYANDPATIDGVVHIFNTIKTPLRDADGKIWGVLAFARDITERERLMAEQQKRALQLQTAAEVSHAASSLLSLDDLLPQAVELVRARFNLYYVGIFLVDESGHWATLRAGTGEAGRQMLAAGHKLNIGGSSMISWCIVNRRARITLDVGEEAVRFDNPLLPLTRSELALPLISRGSIIGAVTIQSDQPAAFTAEDITVLQTMADQIGNATENARLFEQSRAALQEVDAINRRLTGEAWGSYLRHRSSQQVIWVSDNDESAPAPLPKVDETLSTGQINIEPEEDKSQATVTAPIMLRGQTIGALRVQTPMAGWNEDVQTILTSVAGHIAQAAENARLLAQTEERFARERALAEATDKIRRGSEIERILQTAAGELAHYLGAARVAVHIGAETSAKS